MKGTASMVCVTIMMICELREGRQLGESPQLV